MNRTELARAAKERLNGNKLTQDEVAAVLSAVLDSIGDALRKGDKVQLVGFGTFEARKRPARTGRNPRTNEPMEIPAAAVPMFKAGATLKTKVNG